MYGLLYECKFLTIEETNKKKKLKKKSKTYFLSIRLGYIFVKKYVQQKLVNRDGTPHLSSLCVC